MSSLRRGVALNVVGNSALAVLAIASGSIASYRYHAEGRGIIGVAQVISAVAASLGSLGLGEALLYFLASSKPITRQLLIITSLVGAICGALVGVSIGLIATHVANIGDSPARFVLFCGVVASGTAFYVVPAGALRGTNMLGWWNSLRVTAALAWVVALLAGGSLADLRLDYIAYAYTAALLLLGSLAISRCDRHLATEQIHWRGTLAALVQFGVPSAFSAAPLLLNARIDQIALATAVDTDVVGNYAAAAGYCWATVPLIQAITNVVSRQIAAESDRERRTRALVRLSNFGVTAVIASTVVAFVAAPVLLRLLNGPGFGEANAIARVLLVGAALQGVALLLEEAARGLGQPRYPFFAEILGLAAMIVALIGLSRHGAVPTAVASVIGYAVTAFVIARAVSRYSEVGFAELLRPGGWHDVRKQLRRAPTAIITPRNADENRPQRGS